MSIGPFCPTRITQSHQKPKIENSNVIILWALTVHSNNLIGYL